MQATGSPAAWNSGDGTRMPEEYGRPGHRAEHFEYSDGNHATTQLRCVTMCTRTDSDRYAAPMSRWGFVGRTDELNRLLSAVTGAERRGIFFSGNAGIGKSRLLREGMAALPPTGTPSGRSRPAPPRPRSPSAGWSRCSRRSSRRASPPPASCAGRWTCCNSRRPAGGSCSRSTTRTCSTRRRRRWCTWSPASDNATVVGTSARRRAAPAADPRPVDRRPGRPRRAEAAAAGRDHRLLSAILEGPVDAASADRLGRLSAGQPAAAARAGASPPTGGELTRTYGIWKWTGRLELAPNLTDLIDVRIGQLTPRRTRGGGAGRLRRTARPAPAQPGRRPGRTWRPPRNAG